jgi:hypothetical protein
MSNSYTMSEAEDWFETVKGKMIMWCHDGRSDSEIVIPIAFLDGHVTAPAFKAKVMYPNGEFVETRICLRGFEEYQCSYDSRFGRWRYHPINTKLGRLYYAKK